MLRTLTCIVMLVCISLATAGTAFAKPSGEKPQSDAIVPSDKAQKLGVASYEAFSDGLVLLYNSKDNVVGELQITLIPNSDMTPQIGPVQNDVHVFKGKIFIDAVLYQSEHEYYGLAQNGFVELFFNDKPINLDTLSSKPSKAHGKTKSAKATAKNSSKPNPTILAVLSDWLQNDIISLSMYMGDIPAGPGYPDAPSDERTPPRGSGSDFVDILEGCSWACEQCSRDRTPESCSICIDDCTDWGDDSENRAECARRTGDSFYAPGTIEVQTCTMAGMTTGTRECFTEGEYVYTGHYDSINNACDVEYAETGRFCGECME